jgi:hypothetical protein
MLDEVFEPLPIEDRLELQAHLDAAGERGIVRVIT